jgi:hypothetical protein
MARELDRVFIDAFRLGAYGSTTRGTVARKYTL